MKQTIRIIGGQFRGKKLHFPAMEGLRPTPDRVRETLFNWLMHDIRDANCLDAFAGSGALGFEAFSRGAQKVTLVEHNPLAYANLVKSAAAFHAPELTVLHVDACKFLQQCQESFDIIFLDPPFSKHLLPQCLEALTISSSLKTGGLLYIESPQKVAVEIAVWQEVKLKQAGHVTYGLYKKR